jgi:hypothetical protein
MLHSNIKRLVNEKKLNVNVVVGFIQEAIELEQSTIEVNKHLHNFNDYLESEDKITQAEILMSLLRRFGNAPRGL